MFEILYEPLSQLKTSHLTRTGCHQGVYQIKYFMSQKEKCIALISTL